MERMRKKEKKSEGMTIGQLIKNLMDKKWIPRGDNRIVRAVYDIRHKMIGLYEDDGKEYFELVSKKSLRELVSKESGLWQFCIANHLLKKYSDLGDDDEYVIGRWQNGMDGKTTDGEYIDENYDSDIYHQDESYQYRIIESALCDEDKLEDFLLQNIKIDG